MSGSARPSPAGGWLARLRRCAPLVLWFMVPFLVYVTNDRAGGSGDTVPASLIPVSLVLDGTVLLDRFAAEERRVSAQPYWLSTTAYGTASAYPIATGVLATPILAVPILVQQWWRPLPDAEWRRLAVGSYQSLAAAVLASLSVVLFRHVCEALGFANWLAAVLTLLFAFGSQTMSTASQALWQHGPGVLMMLGAVAALLDLPRRPMRAAILLGTCLGVAVAIRPTNLLLALPVSPLVLWRAPRQAALAGAASAAVLAPFLLYGLALFDALAGAYGRGGIDLSPAAILRGGLAGVLLSPGRGLLPYFPATLLAVVLLAGRPAIWRNGLAPALAAGILLQILVVAAWPMWWGGHCFGPRLLSEIEAPILLLIGLAFPAQPIARRRAGGALCVILAISVGIQAVGSYAYRTLGWNVSPVNVDSHPERLWDVADNPVFRGLLGGPGQ